MLFNRNASSRRRPRAFTLIELAVVNMVIVAVIAMLQPAVGKARGSSRDVASRQNMALLGQGGVLYAGSFDGQLFSFYPGNSNVAKVQAIQILSTSTGRPIGDGSTNELIRLSSILPHRRYSHLVLGGFINAQVPMPIAASPFDRNLLLWQQNPVLAQNTMVPYFEGAEFSTGYDPSPNWPSDDVRQMWPYGSTYLTVPTAWNPNNNDGNPESWFPVRESPHLYAANASAGQQRYVAEVRFPSQKVHMFEEFDRLSNSDGLWFAYPHASCNQLFFDGSVRNLRTSLANPGWNPDEPAVEWKQRYRPLLTFPWYADGYANGTNFPMRYYWTRQGLGGLDYGLRELSDGFSKIDE